LVDATAVEEPVGYYMSFDAVKQPAFSIKLYPINMHANGRLYFDCKDNSLKPIKINGKRCFMEAEKRVWAGIP